MMVFNEEVMGGGVEEGGVGGLTNVVLYVRLEPYTKVQVYHASLLSK